VPRVSWTGPAYLAAVGDVLVAYERVLESASRIGEILGQLGSLAHGGEGMLAGAFLAANSDDPGKHRWNTALVLRSLPTWPCREAGVIACVARWLLEELEGADRWLGATDRESPMYLARCLEGLRAAEPCAETDLAESIHQALERGNQRLDAFWSPIETERTGDLKAYSAVLEYLAGWSFTVPAGLVLGLVRTRAKGG
jgi:hypothetical protein